MSGPAPRALLVDYGGVLTTSVSTSFATFCLDTGVSPERLRDVLADAYVTLDGPDDGLVALMETGRISPAEFDRRLAQELSIGLPEPLEPDGLTARMLAGLRPDEAIRDAVRVARDRGVRTGLVSNTWAFDPPETMLAGLFDAVVRSGHEGVRKPHPEIYLLAAVRVGVAPEGCVFVDDLPVNVEGAEAIGMTGVLHRDAAITVPRLETILGMDLGRP